jgi:hypothetical protein
VRQLGLVLDALPKGSPSVLVEMAGEGDFMKELKELQGQVKIFEEFHHDALEVSLRAFLDRVLECFYIHARKENLGSTDRSRWLRSQEAQEFVKGKTEMALFQGTSMKVSGRLLKLLKDVKLLKYVKLSSSMINQRSAYSCKLIWVAMALRDLESFNGNFDYHWLFQKTLGMTPDAMVTKWHSGELEQVHSMTKFTLDRRGPV